MIGSVNAMLKFFHNNIRFCKCEYCDAMHSFVVKCLTRRFAI